MFYQILIETKEKVGNSNQNREITVLDKTSRDEVLKEIVIPYLNKSEFFFNGYRLDNQKINRLKIMTTEKTVRELSEYESNDNSSSGLIIYVSPQDILGFDKYITDVTNELLDEAKNAQDTTLDYSGV